MNHLKVTQAKIQLQAMMRVIDTFCVRAVTEATGLTQRNKVNRVRFMSIEHTEIRSFRK